MELLSSFSRLSVIVLVSSSLGCSLVSRKSLNAKRYQAAEEPVPTREPDTTEPEITEEALPPLVEENQIFEAEESLEELPSPKEESVREVSKSIHSIPVEINKDVQKWIDYFAKKDRDRFQRFLNRGAKYREVVENVLKENGLPSELYYLAMIESGYQNHATSRASAVGVWQFIRGTGRRYGLEINRYVDERRDPIRATEAAVRYLKDLHNVFGSWHLAMAGYNAGEYRVVRAVFKGKTRNFWKLVKLKALPRETRNYIPKFLAAVEIGQNPLKYGFTVPLGEKYPNLQAIQLPNSLTLKDIAQTAGVSVSELKKVNPHLIRSVTPPGRGGYEVWVPLKYAKKVEGSKTVLAKKAKRIRARVARNSSGLHRVRRGENLTVIARRYGMSVSQLKRLNNLRSNRIYVGSRLKVHGTAITRYRVRRGDNLSVIAKKFGMTLSQLKRLNGLRSNRIMAGTRLKVRQPASKGMTRYRVRRGDNLTKIAQEFGTSVQELKRINSIRTNTIFPGQIIQVSM